MAGVGKIAAPVVACLVGLVVGITYSSSFSNSSTVGAADRLEAQRRALAKAQATAHALRAQLRACEARRDATATPVELEPAVALHGGAASRRWDDTPTNQRLHELLEKVGGSRREVMLALANDVMMCSNKKTCWWNGGNVLETFLKSVTRLGLKNVVVVNLDDATQSFCETFAARGVSCLRLELPVPKAQANSRGANMISTLKYGLLRQALLMEYAVLVVDLDIVFLRDPFEHLHRDADVEASTDGFSRGWASGQVGSVHEPAMGWGAGGLYIQHFTLNVGCAYFRPTPRAVHGGHLDSRAARGRFGG